MVGSGDNKPRGVPKSGRFWKEQKTRFATIKKSPGLKRSFEEKQKYRNELKRIKDMSRGLVAERNAAKELRKQRRRENIEKRKENAQKSEVVQVIKNPLKLKRMSKKQLRAIQKRDAVNFLKNNSMRNMQTS